MNDTSHEARTPGAPRLLDRVRDAIKRRHYVKHVMNKGGRGVKSPLDGVEQPRAAYAA